MDELAWGKKLDVEYEKCKMLSIYYNMCRFACCVVMHVGQQGWRRQEGFDGEGAEHAV